MGGHDNMYIIGIDGGGTKTKGVLAHQSGEVLTTATVGASNPNLVDASTLLSRFKQLFRELKEGYEQEFLQVRRLFAGISGCGHPLARKNVQETIQEAIEQPMEITIDHDAIIALFSGTLGEAGIVQISGTGSITFGVNVQGERGRVGGWGHLLGEVGSGYSLGSRALKAIFDAYDGLGEKTILTELILNHFEKNEVPDLVHPVYRLHQYKDKIATLSKIVAQAADQKDAVAQRLLKQNATEMAESIQCLINRLFPNDSGDLAIVLTGGLFHRFDLFKPLLEAELDHLNIRLILPQMDPAGGAVAAALKEEGQTIQENFVETYINSGEGKG